MFDPAKVHGSYDSIETAVERSDGEIYQFGSRGQDDVFILKQGDQHFIYARPEYSGHREVAKKSTATGMEGYHSDHVASRSFEAEKGQGYVLMGKVPAKVNTEHGRRVENQWTSAINPEKEKIRVKHISRGFNHTAQEQGAPGQFAKPVTHQQLDKLLGRMPDGQKEGAVTQAQLEELTPKEKASLETALFQDQESQELIKKQRGQRIEVERREKMSLASELRKQKSEAGKAPEPTKSGPGMNR